MTSKILALSLLIAGLSAYLGCGGGSSAEDLSESNPAAGAAGSEAAGQAGGGESGAAGSEQAGAGGSEEGGAAGSQVGGAGSSASGSGGAGQGGAGGETDVFAGPTVCTSNVKWTKGDQESPNMHPGRACITCHKEKVPFKGSIQFTVAGTVFPTGHEPDECNGVNASTTKGVEVVITGADGVETVIPVTLPSGNFYKKFTLKTPYKARVRHDGKERVMEVEQTSGDCNSCHTEEGTKGAPGRIVLP